MQRGKIRGVKCSHSDRFEAFASLRLHQEIFDSMCVCVCVCVCDREIIGPKINATDGKYVLTRFDPSDRNIGDNYA